MACKGSRDDLIGEKLLIDMVTGKVKNVAVKVRAALPSFPQSPLISNSQDQMLVQLLSEIIKVYGDIDQDKAFNDMIDDLAKVADTCIFSKLVEKVFTDDQITWGKIIVLFYSVGNLSAKEASVRMDLQNGRMDYEISKNLVLRSVKDQVQRVGKCAPSLPEPQSMNDEREQLEEQLAKLCRDIGDILDQNTVINNTVDGFARVADRQSFQSLVEKVFVGGITWGKIITLICVIGKTVAKILANSVPSIVSWTLDYFRDYLQNWICSRGGWVNSIYSLARYSFERDFGFSSSPISHSSGVIFLSGVLLGGLIVWRLNRGA